MGHKSTEKYNDICTLKHNLLHYVMGETEKGLEADPGKVHVLKEYIEMIKCLSETEKECQEADYYESVVQAMENSDMGYDRMGYTPRRTKDGRYKSQPDRTRMSDGDMGDRRGYDPYDGPYMRMMPGDDRETWGDDEDDQYGKSFNRFRKAKRHYTKTHSEEDKQRMKDASNKHMMETMATIREMWDDADPELRKRMKTDMTNLMASMN